MAPMNTNNSSSSVLLEKKRSLSPAASSDEVRVVGIAEYKHAAQSLAEAFKVDDVARYLVDTPDMATYSEEYKWKLHCDILRYITAAHCYKGIVTTIGPDYDAVALWMPPGNNMDDLWTILRSGMWRLLYKLSSEGRKRFYSEFLPLLHKAKHEVMGARDDDSYYLVYLGSKPSARGKGYAKKLIENMLVRADREGKATYLESSAEANLSYYQRFGFELKTEIALQRAEKPVKMGIMVREPKTVAEGSKKEQVVGL
ncbi:acetyltransferase-2 [Coleophoma crateriformis]|uniref:Acetyltransferase-2 n=1 Tax=Coleophoma crateriformis TaxID=565419 RepID=A0A3D8S2E8_9HELO|nr:acetyltransferase-2 [Coleophoma crateriformis]